MLLLPVECRTAGGRSRPPLPADALRAAPCRMQDGGGAVQAPTACRCTACCSLQSAGRWGGGPGPCCLQMHCVLLSVECRTVGGGKGPRPLPFYARTTAHVTLQLLLLFPGAGTFQASSTTPAAAAPPSTQASSGSSAGSSLQVRKGQGAGTSSHGTMWEHEAGTQHSEGPERPGTAPAGPFTWCQESVNLFLAEIMKCHPQYVVTKYFKEATF